MFEKIHIHLVPLLLTRNFGFPRIENKGVDGKFRHKAKKMINLKIVVMDVGGDRGSTVVKVLCYKSEGRWFDSRWCHWNFSLT